MTETRQLLSFANALADAADAISMAAFGTVLESSRKPDGSIVTATDHAVENELRRVIAARFPEHSVYGEEAGGTLHPHEYTWIIDPIDATSNFAAGIPVFATLIALVHRSRSVIGVASAPAMRERWSAARGTGTRRNGQSVHVSEVATIQEAQVLHGGLEHLQGDNHLWGTLRTLAGSARRTRGFGDYWMHLLVAAGQADVAFEKDVKVWDVAAIECIVEEAGGRVSRFDGGSVLQGGEIISCNALLHEQMTVMLAGPSTATRSPRMTTTLSIRRPRADD